MAKSRKYIVQLVYQCGGESFENTGWTDPDGRTVKPVSMKKALKAIADAHRTYPEVTYRLSEVK